MGRCRTWTEEEVEYLKDKWGVISIPIIAKNLNRSVSSILNKKGKLKLGGFLNSQKNGGVVIPVLLKALGYHEDSYYILTSWVERRGLPIHKVKTLNCSSKVIYIDEFFKWAEHNQNILDFSKFEKNALGEEPKWVNIKRRNDIKKNIKITRRKWTKSEDERLLVYLKRYKYTYKQLAEKMGRSEGAIQRRCCDLKYPYRPLRASSHDTWNENQLQILIDMLFNNCTYFQISQKISKSEKAIRGKVYNTFGTENLDKVNKIMKEDNK